MDSEYFGTGVSTITGFDVCTTEPLDHRSVISTYEKLLDMPYYVRYEGLSVYVKEKKRSYTWDGKKWVDPLDEIPHNNGDIVAGLISDNTAVINDTESTIEMGVLIAEDVTDMIIDEDDK